MKPQLKHTTFLCLLLSVFFQRAFTANAQEINFEWGPAQKVATKDLSPEIVYADNNSVYIFREGVTFGVCRIEKYSTDNFEKVFDIEMKKALPNAAKRKVEYCEMISNKIFVVTSETKSNVLTKYVSIFDSEGQIVEPSKEIDEIKQPGKTAFKGYSVLLVAPNKNSLTLLREDPATSVDDSLSFLIKYYSADFNETGSKSVQFPFKKQAITFDRVETDNFGNTYLLCIIDPSKNKSKGDKKSSKAKEDTKQAGSSKDKDKGKGLFAAIFYIPANGDQIIQLNPCIKEGSVLTNLQYAFDNDYNLYLAGYYKVSKNASQSNFFLCQVNPNTNETSKNIDIPIKLISPTVGKEKSKPAETTPAMPVGLIRHLYFGEDGSYTVIAEQNYTLYESTSKATYEYKCSDDIFISKISSEGKVVYTSIIPKKQYINVGRSVTTTIGGGGGGASFNSRSGMSGGGGGGGAGGMLASLAVGLVANAAQNALLEQMMLAQKKSVNFLSHTPIFYGGKVAFIFNDNPKNVKITKGPVKPMKAIAKSVTVMVTVDEKGTLAKQTITSNSKSSVILMPANYFQISAIKYIVYSSIPNKGLENLGVLTVD